MDIKKKKQVFNDVWLQTDTVGSAATYALYSV